MIVDDALVNFDPQRTGTALGALSELSADHQVLLLTCHPELVEAVRVRGCAAVLAWPAAGGAPPPSPGTPA